MKIHVLTVGTKYGTELGVVPDELMECNYSYRCSEYEDSFSMPFQSGPGEGTSHACFSMDGIDDANKKAFLDKLEQRLNSDYSRNFVDCEGFKVIAKGIVLEASYAQAGGLFGKNNTPVGQNEEMFSANRTVFKRT